jgi:excisionase family DNA binding protein
MRRMMDTTAPASGNSDKTPPPIEPMLTPDEVAVFLSVSKATLCRLTASGKIPHRRLAPRVVRYSRAAVVAWMNGEEVQHG